MDLKEKLIEATGWTLICRLWTQGISWVVTLVLARLLNPEDYGVFAMAMSVIVCFELFQELGLGTAIVQRQNLSNKQISAIFWVITGIGAILFGLLFFLAPVVANFFHEPILVGIVRALGLILVFYSLGLVPYCLLTKEIDLRSRALAEAIAVTVAVLVSVSLAYLGWGVWALVMGQVVRALLKNLGLWYSSGWLPEARVSFSEITELFVFGFRVFLANGSKTLSNSANIMIVGKVLGGNDLGLYTMADTLGNNPLHKITTSILNQVSFPVFCKIQNDEHQLKKYFLKITQYLVLLGLPVQIGMALVAPDMVALLLSEKWLPIVGLLQIFCIGWFFWILQLPVSPLLTAIGDVQYLVKFFTYSGVIMGVAIWVGAQFGLMGVGFAWICTFPLFRIIILKRGLSVLKMSFKMYLKALLPFILATLIMAVVVFLFRVVIYVPNLFPRLIIEVLIGMGVYCSSVHFFDNKISVEIIAIVREFLKLDKASSLKAEMK